MGEAPNGRRYRQVRDLAEKTTRRPRSVRRWGMNPESVGNARTCPVHAVLAPFLVLEPRILNCKILRNSSFLNS